MAESKPGTKVSCSCSPGCFVILVGLIVLLIVVLL
jgi:hypothetical protein